MTTTKTFSVSLWGSHPDAGNDDCWTGEDFATEAEARAAYDNWREVFGPDPDTTHVELTKVVSTREDGVPTCWDRIDVKRVARDRTRKRPGDGDWRREIAMEAGMLHGIDAYNEAMGYDSYPAEY